VTRQQIDHRAPKATDTGAGLGAGDYARTGDKAAYSRGQEM